MRTPSILSALCCAAVLAACASPGPAPGPAGGPLTGAVGARGPASGATSSAANAASGAALGAATASVAGASMYATRNIVQNAQASPIHRTLVAALVQAQLADTLAGPGPFTVFAPTDTAFNAVPASTRSSLMQDANRSQLQRVLSYHVVPGRLTAAELAAQVRAGAGTASLVTVAGGRLTVQGVPGGLAITDESGGTARITQGDVLQSNGVIHVVDKVLTPR